MVISVLAAVVTKPTMNIVINALAVALTCGVLAWAGDLVRKFGILLYTEQYIASMVALALPLVYLSVPSHRGSDEEHQRRRAGKLVRHRSGRHRLRLRDVRGLSLSRVIGGFATRPWDGVIIAVCCSVCQALRRTSGTAITAVAVGFFVLALTGHLLPGALTGREVQIARLNYFLLWDSSAIFGTPMQIITTIVVLFVFLGNVLFKTGGSAFFTDISMALMGRFRGGAAKIAVMASSLFGTISGNAVANVVADRRRHHPADEARRLSGRKSPARSKRWHRPAGS